jgi:hypothetical protein
MAEYYNREKLYKEVWDSPMIEVCKQYGVSDVALAKTCKKLKIPRPSAGYWAKKAAGKTPSKPRMYPFEKAPKIPIRQIEDPKPRLAAEAFEEADELIQKIPDVPLSDDLENLHPYVRNTRKVFKRQVKKCWKDNYNRIFISGDDVFDINIGQESLDRTSIILQALCIAFESMGLIAVQTNKGIAFRIMNENISIKISESTKKTPISDKDKDPKRYYHSDYDYIPSGILKLEINTDSFSMDERKSWTDGKNKKIEDKLVDIMHHLIRAAAWKKEYEARRKKREEENRIEREKQVERDRLARIEKQRISELETGFKKWLYHKEMSEYVNSVKAQYIAKNGDPVEDFAQWIMWVEGYLEKTNPMNGEYPKYDVKEKSWMNSF